MEEAFRLIGIFIALIGIVSATTGYVSRRIDVPLREIPIGKAVFKPLPGDAILAGLIAVCVGFGILMLTQ